MDQNQQPQPSLQASDRKEVYLHYLSDMLNETAGLTVLANRQRLQRRESFNRTIESAITRAGL